MNLADSHILEVSSLFRWVSIPTVSETCGGVFEVYWGHALRVTMRPVRGVVLELDGTPSKEALSPPRGYAP